MTTAPYGSWRSPITADLIVSATVRLGAPRINGPDTYWLESRPQEGGRGVIVRRTPDGATSDLNPPPFNARTRVHEYGGGEYLVAASSVYFANFADQRVYSVQPGVAPQPLTHQEGMRYADFVLDAARNRLICVREDHTGPGEAVSTIAAIDLATGDETVLVQGQDFYSSPRVSPDGTLLCWLAWDHPNMPWDGTELRLARFDATGVLTGRELIAGGRDESVVQPEWSPDGRLYFASDRSGWWNLYRLEATDSPSPREERGSASQARGGEVSPLHPLAAEFSGPHWGFGMSSYGFDGAGRIVCAYSAAGISHLAGLDTATRVLTEIETPFNAIGGLRVAEGRAVFVAASATDAGGLYSLDLATGRIEQLKATSDVKIDARYVSTAQPVEFPTDPVPAPTSANPREAQSARPEALEGRTGSPEGEPTPLRSDQQATTAHAFYYPPRNGDFDPPPGELPPLIVMSHGGPTAATSPALSLRTQYWTSRGFAVLDVNYGGSTGYGREYRNRLVRNWGIVDVADCVNGARYLVGRGLADPRRLAITGGSAGGYTTLAALTFHDVFKAGASHYGIGDLEALARDTHKFESRYLDNLIAPYTPATPARPDALETPDSVRAELVEVREAQITPRIGPGDPYYDRSPIHHVEGLSCPVIFFQGLEDEVVPPNQAETMVEALRAKGVPVAYLPFEGEQHGFRRAENIKRSLEAELYFYGRIFGFAPADDIEPLDIANLR